MGKVITVWGSPGSGKSMFSCILAKALTRDKRKAIIINAEISVPMLPVWLPEQIIQTNASVGQVLSSVEIDTSLVAGHVTVLKSYPFIGVMGYAAGENPLSYPEVKYAMVLQLVNAAARLVDFVILDCSSNMTNVFTPAAIESGDLVIRILTPDLKGVKLTKREIQLHDQAVCLLQKEHLSHEDKLFIFENFREDAEHINSKSGAFFTPFGLANDFTLQIPCLYGKTIRIIDLCAGIGVLSYAAQLECSDRSRCYADITCVELNPHYVEVGKKVVPEATWICADVLDPFLPDLLGQFDFAIANPPFGRIANNYRKSYMSGEFEYMVIEAASRIAKEGAFIIPQMSAPFVYSGTEDHRWLQEGRARTFEKRTGILLEFNQGIDTAYYKNDWHCTAPICEIVCCDFAGTDTSAA